jgi:DNA-binding NarL/FixJ family response regulator
MDCKLKIMIVEDHAIFREGLKKVLEGIRNIEITGEAENGAIFLEQLKKSVPDIVLMDIKMPVMDGIEATDQALALHPNLKIIILSMFGEEEYLFTLVMKGISGFLLKNTSLNNMERAIRMVADGQQYFSPELNGKLAKRLKQYSSVEIPQFTAKEQEILQLLCKGYNTEEIADALCISKRTVEGYRAKLLLKTNASNTINLVIYALKNKLVVLQDLGEQVL